MVHIPEHAYRHTDTDFHNRQACRSRGDAVIERRSCFLLESASHSDSARELICGAYSADVSGVGCNSARPFGVDRAYSCKRFAQSRRPVQKSLFVCHDCRITVLKQWICSLSVLLLNMGRYTSGAFAAAQDHCLRFRARVRESRDSPRSW